MFTPVETSIGALLLHQATSVLLFQNGQVLGCSGYIRSLFRTPTAAVSLLAGMAASVLPLKLFLPEFLTNYPPVPTSLETALVTVGVGALVGWGTKISMGCTSGHMLCGLSRTNAWSAAAVATFFPMALLTHHLVHPSLVTEGCSSGIPCYIPTYPSRTTTTKLLVLAASVMLAARALPSIIAKAVPKSSDKSDTNTIARQATEFLAGLEFGLGLHITQMAAPTKVLAFLSFPDLDVWDPSMALVILFGILPSLFEIQTRGLEKPPLFSTGFQVPKKTFKDVDLKFVLGAAVFGIGWGLTGTCPGPAVLRSVMQPGWGLLWMGGFWAGGLLISDTEIDGGDGLCH
ncbi:YeeE/YedE family integral membrane protein-like protein [Lophiostoma macrostomum CBS 122681]|uniref:YeeE/YedE family integral membrane protein-like protein n=1 Tax=Lophiostoma macrostomum CBS 122681 TaxID=1314788 RepID=A0A6A6T678_9PLEO|nr:YeeE/YedE family integral membrane protein-like protein [Lophiostoma macrostomum CBS 122681]